MVDAPGIFFRFEPAGQHPSLLPLRRSYSREEPSGLVAHAGICAGGTGQLAFLPRPVKV